MSEIKIKHLLSISDIRRDQDEILKMSRKELNAEAHHRFIECAEEQFAKEELKTENQKLKKLLRQVVEFEELEDDAPCFDNCSSFQSYKGRCCPGPDILDALKEEV